MYRASLFAGKTALVTGGATGIGLSITKHLYGLGANVVMASRREENLKYARDEILKNSKNTVDKNELTYKILDQRDLGNCETVIDEVITEFDQMDFLVANGGGQYFSPFENITPKGWHAVVNTNLHGTFNLCYSAYHAKNGMKDKQYGRIVNMSVSYIQGGMFGMGHSGAARAGVNNLTRTLAQEWSKEGILVNCIAPGVIFSETAADHYGPSGREYFAKVGKSAPMQRLGTPDECAESVVFLLNGSYINGVILDVDGGQGLVGITSQHNME